MAEQELSSYMKPHSHEEELTSSCFSPKKHGEKAKKQRSPCKKIFLHVLSSCFVIAYLAASFNYLAFKAVLYARNAREVVTAVPWLLIVLVCECAYFVGNVMAAIADHLLPPGLRQDLSFLETDKVNLNSHSSINDTNHECCIRVDIPAENEKLITHVMKEPSVECFPRVDILLPCCKEPSDIPQDSIKAALALDYPQDRFKVLVLDDGSDDDLKAFCGALQMQIGSKRLLYLCREKIAGMPHHFKCGNLNYGLKNSDAEYVVMMDADMILHPYYLKKVLPHIVGEEEVSFVQVPQYYYNVAAGDPLNDASVFSYERVLVHRDSIGAAASIGTGAIFRRAHLNLIGGFQHHSITEDTVTSFALFNMGFKSVYLTETLQMGLTPWSLEAYIKQRQRWGRGAFQQFANTYKTMLGPSSKLSFMLKVCFIWHTLYYYLSIINIVLLSTLLCVLAFGWPLHTIGTQQDSEKLLVYISLYMVLWRLTWYSLWLELPNSLQSRNREESQFWWMTPYFFKMVMQSIFRYKSTFTFIPTSTMDEQAEEEGLLAKLKQLKHVRAHLTFIVLAAVAIATQLYMVREKMKQGNWQEVSQVAGISTFLLSICVHMLVPIMYIFWPTGHKPAQRKSLLCYATDGTPLFNPAVSSSKFHWPVLFYEMLSLSILAIWSTTLYFAFSGTHITMH